MSELLPEHERPPQAEVRAAWLDAAARCTWDMRTPKSWTAAGWVYVLRQPADRWYRNRASKIGLTYRDPAVRAKELFSTALARPLNVEFAIFAPNMAKLECDVHARLDARRADETREVFHVELREAIRAVVETADATGNTVGLCLASADARRVAGDLLRHRTRASGVTSTRFIIGRDDEVTPSVDRLRDLMGPHLAEAAAERARVGRQSRSAGARAGAVTGGLVLLIVTAAAVSHTAALPPLPVDIGIATGLAAVAGILGFAVPWVTQTRRAGAALAQKAATIRDILEDRARGARRKPLHIHLLRFDNRPPRSPARHDPSYS